MKSSTRTKVLVVSAAFCGAAAFALAGPSGWSLLPGPTGGRNPPAKADARATGTAAASATPPFRLAANSQRYRDGSYTGPSVGAYYGLVRVRVDVRSGRIVSIDVLQYPSDNPTSRYINSLALPFLKTEVIRAQTVFVDMVSGATLSSGAFLRSASAALREARS